MMTIVKQASKVKKGFFYYTANKKYVRKWHIEKIY